MRKHLKVMAIICLNLKLNAIIYLLCGCLVPGAWFQYFHYYFAHQIIMNDVIVAVGEEA